MVDFRDITGYFGEQGRIASLPSYEQFRDEFDEQEPLDKEDPVAELVPIRERNVQNLVARIASFLWGREVDHTEFLKKNPRIDAEVILYADNEPIRVSAGVPGRNFTFYVKPFDEQRMFGLELERLLSNPNYNFVVGSPSIIEEEVPGIEAEEFEKGRHIWGLPEYVKQLVALDTRCRAMLLGDMHGQNYLVRGVQNDPKSNQAGYEVLTIDPEKIFDIGNIDNVVLWGKRRERAREVLGDGFDTVVQTQIAYMRNRFLENEKQLESLFPLIGASEDAEEKAQRHGLYAALDTHHNDESFLKAENVGALLGMHIRRSLGW